MKKFLHFIFVLAVLSLLQSCHKDSGETVSINQSYNNIYAKSNILVVKGRLCFKDTDAFKSHLQWIYDNQDNQELIKSFNDKINFESMFSVYTKGINIENDTEFKDYLKNHPNAFYPINIDGSVFYEMPSPVVLAYIANENGIFQIGKKICRISFNNYYEITDGDESKIPNLFLPEKDINDNNIFIYKTHDENNRGAFSTKTIYFDNKKRLIARLYKNWVGGTAQAWFYEARTTSQKKGFLGIWYRRKISEIGVSWNTGYMKYYNWPDLITIYAQTNKKTNKSNIMRTVIIAHYPVDNEHSSCLIKHWGKDGTNLKQITNHQLFPN